MKAYLDKPELSQTLFLLLEHLVLVAKDQLGLGHLRSQLLQSKTQTQSYTC